MDTTRSLHHKAMELADRADEARRQGDNTAAMTFFQQAFELESSAAAEIAIFDEPARSVLLRSAATLALECGQFREAERLIATALSGHPPLAIAEELRDLLEKLYHNQRALLRSLAG